MHDRASRSMAAAGAESRRHMIQTQLLEMGFENRQIYALLYLNGLWKEISSPDLALEVMNDPMQHQYVQSEQQQALCVICSHG